MGPVQSAAVRRCAQAHAAGTVGRPRLVGREALLLPRLHQEVHILRALRRCWVHNAALQAAHTHQNLQVHQAQLRCPRESSIACCEALPWLHWPLQPCKAAAASAQSVRAAEDAGGTVSGMRHTWLMSASTCCASLVTSGCTPRSTILARRLCVSSAAACTRASSACLLACWSLRGCRAAWGTLSLTSYTLTPSWPDSPGDSKRKQLRRQAALTGSERAGQRAP